MDSKKFLFILVLLSLIILPNKVLSCGINRNAQWGCSDYGICCPPSGTCEDSCCEYEGLDFGLGLSCVCAAGSTAKFCSSLELESYTFKGHGSCQKDVAWEYMTTKHCPTTDQSVDGSAGIVRWGPTCGHSEEGSWDASEGLVVVCDDKHHTQTNA